VVDLAGLLRAILSLPIHHLEKVSQASGEEVEDHWIQQLEPLEWSCCC